MQKREGPARLRLDLAQTLCQAAPHARESTGLFRGSVAGLATLRWNRVCWSCSRCADSSMQHIGGLEDPCWSPSSDAARSCKYISCTWQAALVALASKRRISAFARHADRDYLAQQR
jgi:hypothetical protein